MAAKNIPDDELRVICEEAIKAGTSMDRLLHRLTAERRCVGNIRLRRFWIEAGGVLQTTGEYW